jgi:hypothetical protein
MVISSARPDAPTSIVAACAERVDPLLSAQVELPRVERRAPALWRVNLLERKDKWPTPSLTIGWAVDVGDRAGEDGSS